MKADTRHLAEMIVAKVGNDWDARIELHSMHQSNVELSDIECDWCGEIARWEFEVRR